MRFDLQSTPLCVIINAENEKKGSSKNEKRKNLCDL